MASKPKKLDRCYIIRNEQHGWTTGPFFSTEKAARAYVEKHGEMNSEYVIFYCEKAASTSTKVKPVWAEH